MKTLCTDVFWIRLNLSTFEDPRWLVIEQLPEAEAVENIYTRLLMLAGKSNANGLLLIYDRVPYSVESLSAVLRRKKAIVELALAILIKFNFVELLDGVYAVLDWDRLQFTDDLAKIAERREKDKIRQREKRQAQKLLSAEASGDATTDNQQMSAPTELETDTYSNSKNNNNVVVLALATSLLQKKWPHLSMSATAVEAVAIALESKGEDFVCDNIEYVRRKAKDNPSKYLVDALSNDYAAHQQKSVKKALAIAQREQQAVDDKRRRMQEDEEIQRWKESPEGQADLARLRGIGPSLRVPTS